MDSDDNKRRCGRPEAQLAAAARLASGPAQPPDQPGRSVGEPSIQARVGARKLYLGRATTVGTKARPRSGGWRDLLRLCNPAQRGKVYEGHRRPSSSPQRWRESPSLRSPHGHNLAPVQTLTLSERTRVLGVFIGELPPRLSPSHWGRAHGRRPRK